MEMAGLLGSVHHQLFEFAPLLSLRTPWESSARESNLHCLELSTVPKQWHEDVEIMRQLLIRGLLTALSLLFQLFAVEFAVETRNLHRSYRRASCVRFAAPPAFPDWISRPSNPVS
jgi:hypothetical protein